jgi:hypothetical protein
MPLFVKPFVEPAVVKQLELTFKVDAEHGKVLTSYTDCSSRSRVRTTTNHNIIGRPDSQTRKDKRICTSA